MEYQLPPDERLRLPSAAWQIIRFGAIYTVCVLWRLGCWITCMNMPRGTGTYGKVMLQGRHSKSHSFHKSVPIPACVLLWCCRLSSPLP